MFQSGLGWYLRNLDQEGKQDREAGGVHDQENKALSWD